MQQCASIHSYWTLLGFDGLKVVKTWDRYMYTLHVIVAVWICDWHHQGVTRPASSVPVWVNCLRQIKTVISGLQLQPLSHFWLKYCKQPHYQPPLWALQSASLILRISARLSASSVQMALHINSASCWLSSLFVLVQSHVLSFSVLSGALAQSHSIFSLSPARLQVAGNLLTGWSVQAL